MAEIVAGVREAGDTAVRAFSARFDKSTPERLEVSERGAGRGGGGARSADPGRHRVRHRQRARPSPRRSSRRSARSRSSCCPGCILGHRVIPIERVGAYVPGGRYPLLSAPVMTIVPAKVAGRRRGHRLPAAERAPGDDRRLPSVGRGPDLPDRRGAGDRGDGVRDRERAEGRQDRRAGQRLRQRGEAAGVRAGRDRPAGRAVGDLRARGRDRRRGDDRDRPAGAGRARRAHPGRADHHRPARWRRRRSREVERQLGDLATAGDGRAGLARLRRDRGRRRTRRR